MYVCMHVPVKPNTWKKAAATENIMRFGRLLKFRAFGFREDEGQIPRIACLALCWNYSCEELLEMPRVLSKTPLECSNIAPKVEATSLTELKAPSGPCGFASWRS